VSANADKRYRLVRKVKVSTASEHDTTHVEDVLDPANTNRDILADKGYVDGERKARLSKQGWRMHIQRKGSKDKPLSEVQQRRNHRIAKTRARIEHVFAGLAQMGGKMLRSIGVARARLHLNWKVAAYGGRGRGILRPEPAEKTRCLLLTQLRSLLGCSAPSACRKPSFVVSQWTTSRCRRTGPTHRNRQVGHIECLRHSANCRFLF
jgi:hypothetical protein